jgi:hypothetical protein
MWLARLRERAAAGDDYGRLFDVVNGPKGWNDDSGYGAGEVGKPAFVVVTNSPPESVRLTDLDWTEGVEALLGAGGRCVHGGARRQLSGCWAPIA